MTQDGIKQCKVVGLFIGLLIVIQQELTAMTIRSLDDLFFGI